MNHEDTKTQRDRGAAGKKAAKKVFYFFLFLVSLCLRGFPARAETRADKTYEQLKLLVDILGYVQDDYVDDSDARKLVYGAARGLVGTLDPFSQFLDPELNRELKSETEGQFGGVGLRLALKDGWLTVMTPMPGTPAYRLGILPGDRVAEIDGAPTKELELEEALKRMRGAPGTAVRVKLLRGSGPGGAAEGAVRDLEITRELIKIDSVVWRRLESGAGYVRVLEFSSKTVEDLADALKQLAASGISGLVLDLRDDPGGLLSAAVETASLFLGEGKLVVYTQGRRPESRQDFNAGLKAPYESLPLVVLINGGSASASEIVAGALQDHKRAAVVGQRSYGKGSVQSLIPLPDGSGLRLTVARYYTPSGRSIHRDGKNKDWGIRPDAAVEVAAEVEAKLYAQWETVYAKDKAPRSAVKPEDMVRDEQLDRAVELLKVRAAPALPASAKAGAGA
ncbi:MAG: S41 family peptidase [Elusimicrobia bacterium]|nr:S41 family peptidase [Elusimicrobiota bacterium]